MKETEARSQSGQPNTRLPSSGRIGRNKDDWVPVITVFAATVLLILATSVALPGFGSVDQIAAIFVTGIFLIVASFGQGVVILTGGMDLSIGVVVGIGGMVVTMLTHGTDGPLIYALPLALFLCTVIGVINGIGVAIARIQPFIMTLAVGITVYGIGLGLTFNSAQQPVAPLLGRFMVENWLGVPIPIIFTALFVLAAIVFQNYTAEGRKLYAIGSNLEAARIMGLPTAALTILAYAISGFCGGLSGVLLAGYSSSATLDMGQPLLLTSIAAVVVGGARVTGGKGLYIGTFFGAVFLSTISSVITAFSLSQGIRNLIEGGIIILALVAHQGLFYFRRGGNHRASRQ